MANGHKSIECKNCEARYKIPATFTGHKVTCKHCGHPIFIRSRTTTKRRATARRYTRVKGTPKPKKISPLLYVSGFGCLVILCAIVAYLTMG